MSRYRGVSDRPSGGWVSFCYITFALSLLMVGGGIAGLPLTTELRWCLAAGVAVIVWSSFKLGSKI